MQGDNTSVKNKDALISNWSQFVHLPDSLSKTVTATFNQTKNYCYDLYSEM